MPDGWPWGGGGALNGAPPSFFDPSLVPAAPWMNAYNRTPRLPLRIPGPMPLPSPYQGDVPFPPMPMPMPLPNVPPQFDVPPQGPPMQQAPGMPMPVSLPSSDALVGVPTSGTTEQLPPDERSWLGFVGDVLDRPGNAVRSILDGKPLSGLSSLVPFSGYDARRDRVSGQDLLHDAIGMNRTDDFFTPEGLAGFGAELLTDPAQYFGIGELGDAEKAAQLLAGHLASGETAIAKALAGVGSEGERAALSLAHPQLGIDLIRNGNAVSKAEQIAQLAEKYPTGNPIGEAARQALESGTEGLAQNVGEQADAGQRALLALHPHIDPLGLLRFGGKFNPINYLPKVPLLTEGIDLGSKPLIEGGPVMQGLSDAWRTVADSQPGQFVGGLFGKLNGVTDAAAATIKQAVRDYKGGVQSDVEKAAEGLKALQADVKAASENAREFKGNLYDALGEAMDDAKVQRLKANPATAQYGQDLETFRERWQQSPEGKRALAREMQDARMAEEAGGAHTELDPALDVPVGNKQSEALVDSLAKAARPEEGLIPQGGLDPKNVLEQIQEAEIARGERLPLGGEQNLPLENGNGPLTPRESTHVGPLPVGEGDAELENAVSGLEKMFKGGEPSVAEAGPSPREGVPSSALSPTGEGEARQLSPMAQKVLGDGNVMEGFTYERVPTKDWKADPERLQYKSNYGEGGGTGSLKGKTFNPTLYGTPDSWRDPETGEVFALNSHNRRLKAIEAGLPDVMMRMVPAATAEEARFKGALINIAEGHGTAFDAAGVFRDSGLTAEDLPALGLKMSDGLTKVGLDLSGLSDELFKMAAEKKLPIERAAMIGAARLSPDEQMNLLKYLDKKKNWTNNVLQEALDTVKGAGTRITSEETLFGTDEKAESLFEHKMQVQAKIKELLSKEKNVAEFAGRNADTIENAGMGEIDTEKAQELSAASRDALYRFDKYKQSHLSPILDAAAERVAGGAKAGKVAKEILRDVKDTLYERGGASAEAAHLGGDEGVLRQEAGARVGAAGDDVGTLDAAAGGGDQGPGAARAEGGAGEVSARAPAPVDDLARMVAPEGEAAGVGSRESGVGEQISEMLGAQPEAQVPPEISPSPREGVPSSALSPTGEGEGVPTPDSRFATPADERFEEAVPGKPEMPDQDLEKGLRGIGMEQRAAAETAAKMLPPGTTRDGMAAIQQIVETGLKGHEPEDVARVVKEVRDKYDAMFEAEKAAGLATPELQSSPARKLLYGIHATTEEHGRPFFSDLAKDPAKQAEVFKALEDARAELGIERDAKRLAPREAQIAERARRLDAAGIEVNGQPVPTDLRGIGLNQLNKVDPETRAWMRSKGLEGEFLKFAQEFGATHESMIPRLDAYRDLTAPELNDVFEKFGAKGPVFQEDPAAALAVRQFRSAKAIRGAEMLSNLGAQYGHIGDFEEEIKWKPSNVDGITQGRNGDGEKVFGIPELNDIRERSGKPPIYFDDPQTAKVLRDSYQGVTETEKVGKLLQWYDKTSQLYRSWLTRFFPAHHVRMAVGDRLQMYIGAGMPFDAPEIEAATKLQGGKEINFNPPAGAMSADELNDLLKQKNITSDNFYSELKRELGVGSRESGGTILDKINPLNPRNALIEAGDKVGALLTNAPSKLTSGTLDTLKDVNSSTLGERNKIALFMWELNNGKSVDDAAASVARNLYDYSKSNMSDFEKDVVSRALLFYPYARHVVPQVGRAMVENLGALSSLTKLNMQPGKPDLTPDYTKDFISLPHGKDKDGNSQLLYDLGTPVEEAAKMLTPDILQELNPIPKTALELMTGRDFFLHKDIEDANKAPHYVEDLPSSLQDMLGAHAVPTKNGTREIMNPWARYAIDASPFSRFSTTASRLADPRKSVTDDLVNLLSGSRSVSVDEGEEEARARRAMIIQKLKEKERAGQASEFTSFSGKDAESKQLVKMLHKR